MIKAILNEKHEVIPEPDIMKWGTWFESADRIVKQETIGNKRISTVFLGLDHSFCFDSIFGGKQLWFETMVFLIGSYQDEYMDRYATWDEAVIGHERIVEMVKSKIL